MLRFVWLPVVVSPLWLEVDLVDDRWAASDDGGGGSGLGRAGSNGRRDVDRRWP